MGVGRREINRGLMLAEMSDIRVENPASYSCNALEMSRIFARGPTSAPSPSLVV